MFSMRFGAGRDSRVHYLARMAKGVVETKLMWPAGSYGVPVPSLVKRAVIGRYCLPDRTWIETGTYLGDTTRFLADRSKLVYSIEPDPILFLNARNRFLFTSNIEVVHGTSENALAGLIDRVSGDVAFWLDGHFSAGISFKGENATPIEHELATISSRLDRLSNVTVLIDDFRCFPSRRDPTSSYPSRGSLVDWAEGHGLAWDVCLDVFLAWTDDFA